MREWTTDAERAAMLKSVHGELIGQGMAMGEIGRCELDALRELIRLNEIRLQTAVSVMTQANDKLQECVLLLREIEWLPLDHDETAGCPECPYCGGMDCDGHSPGCRLAEILK